MHKVKSTVYIVNEGLKNSIEKLNKKLNELGFNKINPSLLKDYLSLVDFKKLTDTIKTSVLEEKDELSIELLSNKINLITASINKNKYYKKSFFEEITVYYYEKRVDIYVRKDFNEENFKLAMEGINNTKNNLIYINNKKIEENLKLEYSEIRSVFLNKNASEIKIKIELNS